MISAVVVEGRRPGEVAAQYRVSRSWLHEMLARYRAGGEAGFEPRSRRPRRSPAAMPASTIELIAGLRADLGGRGLDAGPATIAWATDLGDLS